jgi:hypothetical protein
VPISIFRAVHAAAENEIHAIRRVRAANSTRFFGSRITYRIAPFPFGNGAIVTPVWTSRIPRA